MIQKTTSRDTPPYTTRDGSVIRELMHPRVHGNRNQSLALSTVSAGGETLLHRHLKSEEIYHVIRGSGLATVGDDTVSVAPGDTVLIPPGAAHRVRNTGDTPLEFFCACSPPYSHDDTEMIPAD
ncbi:MAG: hypothetical protein DRP57_09375 [Spirochaetes bacterium]|nr:MAG: hypothetical protein DRP57_09375 [Spirochaetota bacterium]